MFEKEAFGTLERLVTQKLLDVVKRVTKTELKAKGWLLRVAPRSDRSHEELLAIAREFLETDIFNISADIGATCLDPLIESWNIDLATFGMEIVLNRRLAAEHLTTIEFVERDCRARSTASRDFSHFWTTHP